jgi:membrane protease YdiL (CAAX protease family)
LGTVLAAVLFSLFHLVNLVYQPVRSTLQQALTACVIGLVFGVLYDHTRNLVGAGLAHSLADFSGAALPLLAYVMANP